MPKDLDYAKNLLETGEYTCVLCKDKQIFKSKSRGVKPLLELLDNNKKYMGFSIADKIVGKAAAYLYLLMEVEYVYAEVISRNALKLLTDNNIKVYYQTITENIINRKGNDICPMEKAVHDANDSLTALHKIQETITIIS